MLREVEVGAILGCCTREDVPERRVYLHRRAQSQQRIAVQAQRTCQKIELGDGLSEGIVEVGVEEGERGRLGKTVVGPWLALGTYPSTYRALGDGRQRQGR